MGDRCFMSFECRPEDIERLTQLFSDQDVDLDFDPDGYAEEEECSYSLSYEIEGVIAESAPNFAYYHGSGDDYGAGRGIYWEGQHYYIRLSPDGDIFVPLLRNGELDEVQLSHTRNFLRVEKLFTAWVEGAEPEVKTLTKAELYARAKQYGHLFLVETPGSAQEAYDKAVSIIKGMAKTEQAVAMMAVQTVVNAYAVELVKIRAKLLEGAVFEDDSKSVQAPPAEG